VLRPEVPVHGPPWTFGFEFPLFQAVGSLLMDLGLAPDPAMRILGMATFLPLGFLCGWVASFVLKKLNLLRVPPEVELAGLDVAEYTEDLYMPDHAKAREMMIEPDGTLVVSEVVLTDADREVVR
jgi:hypothetical protein